MTHYAHESHRTQSGYLTERIRTQYISAAISAKRLPDNAHRMAEVLALTPAKDASKPIQFWQLYSLLGQRRIVAIVNAFYQRVFADEPWFTSVFERIGPIEQHVRAQAAMWIDTMGGGMAYHGGEFRLSFHHTHNAFELMTDKGAERWVNVMVQTLDDPTLDLTGDPRVRRSINTFLSHFMDKYAAEYGFGNHALFGEINPPLQRPINFLRMSEDEIAALSENELIEALSARRIDVSEYQSKQELVNRALRI
ncbi:hypothetical protein OAS86_03070 [Gammaproteobacteria bacterium]|nr:hypothetical protein [Gammaproteobacteria bacterium]